MTWITFDPYNPADSIRTDRCARRYCSDCPLWESVWDSIEHLTWRILLHGSAEKWNINNSHRFTLCWFCSFDKLHHDTQESLNWKKILCYCYSLEFSCIRGHSSSFPFHALLLPVTLKSPEHEYVDDAVISVYVGFMSGDECVECRITRLQCVCCHPKVSIQ